MVSTFQLRSSLASQSAKGSSETLCSVIVRASPQCRAVVFSKTQISQILLQNKLKHILARQHSLVLAYHFVCLPAPACRHCTSEMHAVCSPLECPLKNRQVGCWPCSPPCLNLEQHFQQKVKLEKLLTNYSFSWFPVRCFEDRRAQTPSRRSLPSRQASSPSANRFGSWGAPGS